MIIYWKEESEGCKWQFVTAYMVYTNPYLELILS